MDRFLQNSRVDQPIEDESEDLLDRSPFIQSLVQALIIDELDVSGRCVGRRATGSVVGLTGRWGLGKSSVMNLLFRQLREIDHVIVAYFNPWLFNGRDELVSGFFSSLRDAMGLSASEAAQSLRDLLDRYRGAIDLAGHGVAFALDAHGGSGHAMKNWSKWAPKFLSAIPKSRPKTPEHERRELENKIKEKRQAIVVLIDELDRIEDNEVRIVAQLIKAIGDIKGVSYLVAYDPDRVIQALGRGDGDDRRKSGELYLEKIIQHAIPLRPLFSEDSGALLNEILTSYKMNLPIQNTYQKNIIEHIVDEAKTPRAIKRLIATFSVLENIVRNEICIYDVLLYCWILTKSPTLREKIASHIDDLVIDPSSIEAMRRSFASFNEEKRPTFIDILGPSAYDHIKSLELLFPNFSNDRIEDDGNRLLRRRNLVRMVYLGNPPGLARRTDIEKLWNNSDLQSLELLLRNALESGKLAPIFDRLDDLLPSLPVSGDKTFWVGVSRSLYRKAAWITQQEPTRALAEDAIMILYSFVRRGPDRVDRLKNIIDLLINDNDLILVPAILRRNLFAHGLTIHKQTARNDGVLSRDDTDRLLEREIPRYRDAVMNGTALRHLPNAELIYVLLNSGRWDSLLQDYLTGQLTNLDAILTFSALFVPPNVALDLPLLSRLVDISALRQKISNIEIKNHPQRDPWIENCYNRLKYIISDEFKKSSRSHPA